MNYINMRRLNDGFKKYIFEILCMYNCTYVTGKYSELNICASIYGTIGQKIKKKYDFE